MKKHILLFLILFCVKQGKAQIGAALSFDGVDDIVSMATTSAANNLGPAGFTIEAWIFPRSSSSAHSIIRKTGDYNLFLYNGNLYAEIWPLGTSSTTWKQFSGTAPLTVNVWSHVAFTWDGTTGLLYVNGSVIAAGSLNSTVGGSETLHLGASAIFGNPLLGSLDEVRIWNTVRTKCQINTFKDCEIATTATGLVANYHFNQGVAGSSNSSITSLTDASGNSFTGTLSNFALAGTASNWIAPGGVVSGYITPLASPTVSSTVSNSVICNGSSTTLNGTGVSTYTWTGGITNGVAFSPSVSTTYSVTGTSVAGCTASNTATQFVTVNTSPLVSIAAASSSLCAGQATTLTVSPPTSYGLRFNGTNGYVSIPTNSNIPVGNSAYTMEAWINSTSLGVSGIVGFGNWGNGGQVNALRFGSSTQIINYWWGLDLTVTCPNAADGLWHHIAATFDGTTRKIYMDGVLLGSDLPGATSHSVTAINMRVGSTNSGEYFSGRIDDVRIWNIAKTQQQLNQDKTNCMNGNESGLVLLYNMNNGAGSSNVTDLTSNNNTGVLTNMNTTTDWVTGNNNCNTSYVWNPTALTTPSVNVNPATTTVYSVTVTAANGCANTGTRSIIVNPLPVISASTTNSIICNGQTTTLNGSGASTYTWTGGATNGVAFAPSITTIYTVTGTSVAGCTSTNVATSTVGVMSSTVNTSLQRPPGSGYAVRFDGVDDVINMGPSYLLNNVALAPFSMDAWIFPTSTSGVTSIIRKDGDFDLYLNGGVLSAEAWTGGGNFTRATGTSVTLNQWNHVAAVWNGSAFTLYINGTISVSSVGNFNNGLVSNLNIGGSTNFGQYFVGTIDEVCIWRIDLTQTEVRDWMCKKIKTTHPKICKLVAYYRFDESTGNTLFDYTNGQNGTLANGPARVLSGAPLGDNAIWLANATVSSTLSLAHPSGDNLKATLTAGTASLMVVYSVDTIPNVTTPPGTFNQLSQIDYFGVKLFGSTGGVYSVLYDYTGHVGIGNESTLGLASRANNSTLSWTEETSTALNTTANTLLLGGQTGTEFILASRGGNSLPIELLYFKAELNNSNTVDLTWATASEINNAYYVVQRSSDGFTWEDHSKKTAEGTTTTKHNYYDVDGKPYTGLSYYRLKQVDFNGTYTYSQIESVTISTSDFVNVSPNPFSQYCKLEFKIANTARQIEVYNSFGQQVLALFIPAEQTKADLDFSKLAEGIYYLKIDGLQIKQKLINYNH